MTIRATLLCLALLLVTGAQSFGDDLDELLSGDVSPSTAEVAAPEFVSVPDTYTAAEHQGPDAAHHASWQPVVALPQAADKTAPRQAEKASASSSSFSPVPEPSAIALAVLALVYFLVFGRRHGTV